MREAGAFLGEVSTSTVRELVDKGALRAINIGAPGRRRALRFDREDLEAFEAARETAKKVHAQPAVHAERGPRSGLSGTLFAEVDPTTRDSLRIVLDAHGRLTVEIFREGRVTRMTCSHADAVTRLATALLPHAKETRRGRT